jgi:putative ABC transport system permease protein
MLRSYLAAAFGNLGRNWLYTGVTVLGLAVGFAAAILIGLYLRDEASFDRFVPDHQRVYRLQSAIVLPGEKPDIGVSLPSTVAGQLVLDVPGVERAARLQISDVGLRNGASEAVEPLAWVDPGFFRILRMPVLAGDADAALEAPDGLVLTRQAARKYFGEDAPIGKVLQVSLAATPQVAGPEDARQLAVTHAMRVLAVLADPPSSSHIAVEAFGSGRAALSTIAMDDRSPSALKVDTLTYVKLKPGASAVAIEKAMPAFANRHYPRPNGGASIFTISLQPLSQLHFSSSEVSRGFRPKGDRKVDVGIGTVGVLIIVIAAINFVTLMTARATRRAVEVGIRKAVGARRGDLIGQFMGEALVYVLAGMLIGVSLVELLLPEVNAFVGRDLRFDYLGEPRLILAILGALALTTLLAGVYPAMVLSSFRPVQALKGAAGPGAGSQAVRQALVVVQFAILIGLVVMTATIWRQTAFALNQALRLDTDQVLRIGAQCGGGLKPALAAIPGVKDVACASNMVVDTGVYAGDAAAPGHSPLTLNLGPIGVGFFQVQGLEPLAGRFFDAARGQDVVLLDRNAAPGAMPSVVLNQTAVRRLGFKSPGDAVGKTVGWGRWTILPNGQVTQILGGSEVIGVVRDFTLGSIRVAIPPTMYFVDPNAPGFMVLKLSGRQVPETLKSIDRVWRATGHDRTLPKVFESQIVQEHYQDVITQGVAIGVCSGLAILIACLGLFALAAFTTERRIKEIGVRKAMGASTADVVRLLLWQFTKPVLWANLLAWPLAFWAMDHWLHGFAYRVDLPAWLFASAAVSAVLIAWATVAVHAWTAARAAPAVALRYE